MMRSSNNRAAVAAMYEAFGHGDLNGVLGPVADDVVWINHGPSVSAATGAYRGRDGVRQFFQTLAAIDITRFDVQDILEDGDTLIALGHQVYTVRATRHTNEGPFVHVFRFRDGQVIEFHEFEHTDEGAWRADQAS